MADIQVALTTAERDMLIRLANEELGEKRIEVRRTDSSPDYRHELQDEENVLRSILTKLGAPAT